MPRKVNFIVSLTRYRIQLSSGPYVVHAMFGGHGFRDFVLITIGKMEILATFPHLQDEIKVIRYGGWYYTKLVSYVIPFYFKTDRSHIHPLPSTP